MTSPRRVRRSTWILLAVLLVIQVGLVVAHLGRRSTQPHDVPVAVQGPGIIAQSVVERLNHLPGDPLRATALPDETDPRDPVRTGEAVASLVVDPDATAVNVLYVSSVNDPDMSVLMKQVAARVSDPMDRQYETRVVAPAHHPGVARSTVYLLSGLWIVVGFVAAVAWSVLGRVRRRPGVGGARVVLHLAGACAALSLLVAGVTTVTTDGSFWPLWGLGFAAMFAAAAATAALDVLFGPVGVAVAATVLVFLTGPLFSVRDARLLPAPWWQAEPWTPHGATLHLTASFSWFGSSDVLQPALLLGGVILVSLVVLAMAPHRGAESGQERGPLRWRLLALAVAVPTALAVVAAVVLAPAGARVVSKDPVPGASQTACVPAPTKKITDVKGLNDFIRTVRAGPSFQGADVGADVRLQDGRRLWVFADTLRAPDFDGEKFVRNSMLVLGGECLESVLPADRGALIPDRSRGDVGYWPMSIARVQRSGYDIVGVATQRVRATSAPDGIFAFETLGPAMAVFLVAPGKTPQLLAHRDIGPDRVDTARPMWGAAAAVDHGWVYLYGTSRPKAKGIFGYALHVARTRPDDLLRNEKWQYWDGRTWQGSASKAKVLIRSDGGVSQTLSVFHRGNRWYAVSKRNEVLGTNLVVWTAPSPTGPWDSGTTVAALPSDPTTGELRYMPLAHPDLIKDPASVIVSYSRNNTDATKVQNDPFLYRPQFLRVTLPPGRR